MDIAAASPGPRVDTRYRRWTPSIQSRENSRRETHRKEVHRRGASDVPPTHPEKKRQPGAMTKDHRLYHRRQAPAATKTIAVEVVATVDSNGIVVGQETKTHADSTAPTLGAVVGTPPAAVPAVPIVVPAVPVVAAPSAPAVVDAVPSPAAPAALDVQSDIPPAPASPAVPPAVPVPAVPTLPQVPAVPTVALPSVPAVPPFPSDLVVPAYPYASGVSAAAAQSSSIPVVPSPAPTSSAGSSAIPTSASSAPFLASNSTIISTSSSSSTASRASGSSAFSTQSEFDSVSVHAYTYSASHSETISSHFSSAVTSTAAVGTTFYGDMGGGGLTSTVADPALATAGAGGSSPGSTTPLQTPQVVGSVVGSLAGAALILVIILLLLQRHKRQRRGALQLTNDETTERSPPMAQDASKGPRIPSAFLNRFSGMSRSTADTSTSGGERSFQRVSGRKLPSAFSEGMTSEQFARGQTLSGSSFYTDDRGSYGGPGLSKELGKDMGATPIAAGMMNIRPGPARTPVIRHPDEDNKNPFDDPASFPKGGSYLSPPQSPNPDVPRSTLGRSLQSQDGSRSSKFTENV
jgi:hypothetical protein